MLHIVILNFIFTIFPKVYLNKYFMTRKTNKTANTKKEKDKGKSMAKRTECKDVERCGFVH